MAVNYDRQKQMLEIAKEFWDSAKIVSLLKSTLPSEKLQVEEKIPSLSLICYRMNSLKDELVFEKNPRFDIDLK